MIALADGAYRAAVSPVGASLVSLTHAGRELLRHRPGDPLAPLYRGAVLAPWPNRIADGRYRYGGADHQLPVNDVAHGCALHGLLLWTTWTVVRAQRSAVTLRAAVVPQAGYPWSLEVEARYRLGAADGVTVDVTARNTGAHAAPYGVAIHPYLVAGAGRADDWTLRLDAAEVLEVDAGRLIPTGTADVAGSPFDLRAGPRLGARALDHAFGAVRFDGAGRARAELRAVDGRGVGVAWDRACPWVQVHTTDLPGSPLDRSAVAIEPMTCPPDAFNSGAGVIDLEPGERHAAQWCIAALPAPV